MYLCWNGNGKAPLAGMRTGMFSLNSCDNCYEWCWVFFSDLILQVAAMFKIASDTYEPKIPDKLSGEGKEFLLQCFRRDPRSRPTATQLMDHPFVRVYFPAAWACKVQRIGRQGNYLVVSTRKVKLVDELYYIPLSGGIVRHKKPQISEPSFLQKRNCSVGSPASGNAHTVLRTVNWW